MKLAILGLIVRGAQRGMLWLMRWAGQDIPSVQQARSDHVKRSQKTGYVQPDPAINLLLFHAAIEDCIRESETDAVRAQATLNACLEAIRHDSIGGRWVGMLGGLVASGHSPNEAMWRLMANVVRTGMMLERRMRQCSGESSTVRVLVKLRGAGNAGGLLTLSSSKQQRGRPF